MSDKRKGPPTIATFVDLLEQQLPRRTNKELMEVLAILAQHVPVKDRLAVLAALDAFSTVTDPEIPAPAYTQLPEDTPGQSTVEAVQSLVAELENGNYFDRIAWDEEQGFERAWGNDAWAPKADEYFAAAAEAYLNGNHELAARLYAPLLSVFRHAQRVGVFCGPSPAPQMIQTDLDEAKRRFFRSLYVICPPNDRAARILNEIESLREVGDNDVGLRTLIKSDFDADPHLEGMDEFIRQWIEQLKNQHYERTGWGREARRLLREAVSRLDGVEGMRELAMQQGTQHPEAYHEWVGLLIQQDRQTEALEAAREGVANISDPAYRARMADRMVKLAVVNDDIDSTVEATRAAWKALPTEVRLLHLVAAAEAADMRKAVLSMEAGVVLRADWHQSDALACRVLLLANRYEEAVTRFQRADSLGWGRPDHAGVVVLPYILLAATGLIKPDSPSAIETLWGDLDKAGRNYFDRRLLLDQMTGGPGWGILNNEKPYSELLLEALNNQPIPQPMRAELLTTAQLKVDAVVREILHAQSRRGHSLAATLCVAVGEAICFVHGHEKGQEYVNRTSEEYASYAAFQIDLQNELSHSTIFRNPPPNAGPHLTLIK